MLRCTARWSAGFSMVCKAASMVFSSQMVRSSLFALGASRGRGILWIKSHSTA